MLDLPSITSVSQIDIDGNKAIMEREIDGGYEKLECEFPFVASGQKGIAKEPRIPAMRGIMMARRKPLNIVEPVEFANKTEVEVHSLPEPKGACKMIEPENAKELIKLLHEEAKVL
jgi:electron transfer flavoprotein beta subunit